MEFNEWFKLAEDQKLDVLRAECIDIKRMIKYALGAAGVGGALIGSLSTVVVEAVVRHMWP